MNKQGRLILALAMIGLALYLYQQANRTQPAAPDQAAAQASEAPKVAESPRGSNPREYLVAKQNLEPALLTRLTTDLVELRVIPDGVPVPEEKHVVRKFESIAGKVLVASIAQGELLLWTRFGDARSEVRDKKLRDVIPQGMRAISLDVDAVTGSAGFINQGDIVDVLATYTAGGRQLTRIIIQNVEVLARGNEYRSSNRPTPERTIRGDAGGGILFTLKVLPEMAVKLAHIVDERGFNRFRLILKNRDDKVQRHSQGVLLREVLTDRARPPAKKGEIDGPPEVEVLRGASVSRDSSEERISGPGDGTRADGQDAPGAPAGTQSGADLTARIPPSDSAGGGSRPDGNGPLPAN